MQQNDRIKVVLICHFSNNIVRENLLLREGKYYNYNDFGGWNTNIINALCARNDVEIHVISPHRGMKHRLQEFELRGAFYHFYSSDLVYPLGWIEDHFRIQELNNYCRNRKYVKQFIKTIKPDIVNLIGAENPYYSISVLDIYNIPVILHCQTVYANPERVKNTGSINKYRWETELQVFNKTPYIAVTGRMYYDLIKGYKPNSIIFPRRWPQSEFPFVPDVPKRYDFAYWARYLNQNKGFDSAVEAMGKYIKLHPESRFLAVGSRDADWPKYEKRIKELGLEEHLEVHPPFPEYLDLLKYVKQSRCALLPITMDVLSGTILESINMGMPVVTCRTSGTPSLNKERETVLISEIGDSDALAFNMAKLYENNELQKRLRENGFLYLKERNEVDKRNVDVMMEQYKAVMAHYYHGIPIPTKLLYNTEENIDYRNNENS